jgi:hypothetical protein
MMQTDKPQGQRIGWLCLDTNYPFDYHVFRIDEALTMARNGEIKDGKSALALLMCESYLKGEG